MFEIKAQNSLGKIEFQQKIWLGCCLKATEELKYFLLGVKSALSFQFFKYINKYKYISFFYTPEAPQSVTVISKIIINIIINY